VLALARTLLLLAVMMVFHPQVCAMAEARVVDPFCSNWLLQYFAGSALTVVRSVVEEPLWTVLHHPMSHWCLD